MDTAPTNIYTLSLHDALPILPAKRAARVQDVDELFPLLLVVILRAEIGGPQRRRPDRRRALRRESWASRKRSEEHTSELQSRGHLVCRLLLEKKKRNGFQR